MALCDLCSQEMTTASSCTVDVLHQAGTALPLLRYGQERGWKRGPARCGDCGVRRGGLHHVGCDVQRCPSCLGQLISCDCSFDELPSDEVDEDVHDDDFDVGAFDDPTLGGVAPVLTIGSAAAPGPARPFVPLGVAAAAGRARHREALRRVGEWSLAHGRACDLDVAAMCLDALERYRSSTGIRLDRPTVQGVLYADVRNSASALGTVLPEDWHVHLWTVVNWVHDDGGLCPESDPLPALLEPLRCYGGLGVDGYPMPEGTDVDFPCQCHLPYDATCPPGLAQHIVKRDPDTWMAVYSMYPIDLDEVRTFQLFRWADMPGALLPDDPATPAPADWYSPAELEVFRLSSKSHWDLPIDIDGRTVHFLVSHPTPPVFDSLEDRNGTRNFDEIRFWADYVTPGPTSGYIYDDDGGRGGLAPGARFVIAGDQNSDPLDGDSIPGAIQQLIGHPRINTSVTPDSEGAVDATERQGGINLQHRSDPRFDTADFADFGATAPGNLRADYVLPSRPLRILDSGVFWPTNEEPLFRLVGDFPFPSSDHRAVWVDLTVPGGPPK